MKPNQHRQQLILDMITLTGPVTAHTIAEALSLEPKTVVAACVCLQKTGHLHSWLHRSRPRRMVWSVTPPPVDIVCCRKVSKDVGIDAEDLAWMQRYRQQAAQRQQRGQSCSKGN